MPELRVDPLTGLRTIFAPDRAGRPHAWPVPEPVALDPDDDPFAEGHEDRTPPELEAVRPGGGAADTPGWTVRAVPNAFPVLSDDGDEPAPTHDPDLYGAIAATGAHEVLVSTPRPVTSLADLEVAELTDAMALWRRRIADHAERAACVHVTVNEGTAGGASQPHSHAQLFALDFVPALLARERERFSAHAARTMGGNLLQDLVADEVRQRVRLVAIDDEAVLLSPFAAPLPYAMLLVPRRPEASFAEEGPLGASLLADALRRLRALTGGTPPPLNVWVRTAPRGADRFCWHLDIVPRLAPLAGLELGTGLHVNPVTPEQAAADLRDLA